MHVDVLRRTALAVSFSVLASACCCMPPVHDWETPEEMAARVREESERDRQRIYDETRAAAMVLAERAIHDRRCEGCAFPYASFGGSDLSGGQFARASFGAADARGVNLSGADLTQADLGGDFTGSDFRGATLDRVQLSGGNFRLARFDGVDLRTVEWAPGATWNQTVFEGANLEGLSFHGPHGRRNRIRPGHVYGVANGGTYLNGANFRHARLVRTVFGSCSLRGADFSSPLING